MKNLQLRIQTRATIEQWIGSLMRDYGVSATMIEDALEHALLNIKDIVAQELLQSVLSEQGTPNLENKEEEDGDTQPDN